VLRAVADCSHDALFALDRDGRITVTSARAALVFGHSEDAMRDRPLSALVIEPRRDELDALVRRALGGADVFQHDTQARHPDGRMVEIVINLAPLRATAGEEIVGVSVIVQDITERKLLERELRHRSERDPVTGLYNRRHFELELYRATRLAERHESGGAVILLDVDDFKVVNDSRGHLSGDQALRDLGEAIAATVRDSDVVARLGGDEFAVLLPNVDRSGAIAAGKKVLEATRAALRVWGSSVSAGTACFDRDDGFESLRVVGAADHALYRAKRMGGDRMEIAIADDFAQG
jgi:diguanylate cyclase (GGDEF)-like protein/PAS domain S-box-containing protein